MKNSDLAKFQKYYNSLNLEEQEKVFKELKRKAVNSLTGNKGSVTGIISQCCSCIDKGKLIYCFNLQDSKKLFIYYIKSEDEEEIFKIGNIISADVFKKENSYHVENIVLKAKFEN